MGCRAAQGDSVMRYHGEMPTVAKFKAAVAIHVADLLKLKQTIASGVKKAPPPTPALAASAATTNDITSASTLRVSH